VFAIGQRLPVEENSTPLEAQLSQTGSQPGSQAACEPGSRAESQVVSRAGFQSPVGSHTDLEGFCVQYRYNSGQEWQVQVHLGATAIYSAISTRAHLLTQLEVTIYCASHRGAQEPCYEVYVVQHIVDLHIYHCYLHTSLHSHTRLQQMQALHMMLRLTCNTIQYNDSCDVSKNTWYLDEWLIKLASYEQLMHQLGKYECILFAMILLNKL